MKTLLTPFILAALLVSASVSAAPPPGAPAGTTGLCNDGTYSSNAEKKGACRGHKGVKDWYEATTLAGASTAQHAAPAPSAATASTKTMPTATGGKTAPTPVNQPAPGGGAGKVWANTSTKVYHCSGDKYYGTTKHGEYMSEADAKSKGYHADHGKACG